MNIKKIMIIFLYFTYFTMYVCSLSVYLILHSSNYSSVITIKLKAIRTISHACVL